MASLTIRNIPDDAKLRFRQVAAAHGRSMEEHMRQLILEAVRKDDRMTSSVRDEATPFSAGQAAAEPTPEENWVEELIRVADGAGDGVFEREPQPLRDFDL